MGLWSNEMMNEVNDEYVESSLHMEQMYLTDKEWQEIIS